MSNDPFTLDMFGNTALSSGLGLSVTAFGGFDPVAANDDKPDPNPPSPAPAALRPTAQRPPTLAQAKRPNFYLDDGNRALAASWKDQAKANVDAIVLAGEIERQDRPATREEQARLARFIGFGASELATACFALRARSSSGRGGMSLEAH